MSRLVIEEPCPDCGKYEHAHGGDEAHQFFAPMRTIIDPSDPHRIEAAARAIETEAKKWPREDHPLGWGARTMPLGASLSDVASAAVAAFLDPEDKDT